LKAFAIATLVLVGVGATAQATDLRKHYAGKLDFEKGALGADWTANPDDVWMLNSFEYELGQKLILELGPSALVIGKHTDKSGQSAVWGALFPLDPEESTPIVASNPGHGDHVRSIFLRFNPNQVGKLFPKASVQGPGDAHWLMWGKRVYSFKINGHWQAENMPVVPWEHAHVLDIDTVEGKRRCYMVDTKEGSVNYVGAFAERAIPAPPSTAVDEATALAAFDDVWSAFDREYPMFTLRPDVDWDALRATYRPVAAAARTNYEVAGAIGLLLNHLQDLHVWVRVDGNWVPGFNRMRMLNANWQVTKARLSNLEETKNGIAWATAPYDIGYINVWNLSSDGMVDAFDTALEGLAGTKALVIDLRFNGGGDEELGRMLAGRFLDKERTYGLNQYRAGEARDALGETFERKFEPRGPWRYEAPVAVLIGQKTMSSAESLALMFASCPQVTTLGDRTAGSSANPRRLEVGAGIVVNLPRWLDMDPDGKPIDAVGIQPMKAIEAASYADFKGVDPVFDAALKFLKKKKGRKAGKR